MASDSLVILPGEGASLSPQAEVSRPVYGFPPSYSKP